MSQIGQHNYQPGRHSEALMLSYSDETFSATEQTKITAHLAAGLQTFNSRDAALHAMEVALVAEATTRARAAGAEDVRVTVSRDIREAEVEGQKMFIEAMVSATASGRPRVAHG